MRHPHRVIVLAVVLALGVGCGDEPADQAPGGRVAPTIPPDSPKARVDHVQPLIVWAEGGPFSGKAPLTVNFTADLFGGTPPLDVTWTFGDGETSKEENPTHTYTKPGTYEVRLEVSDAREETPDSDWDSVDVVVSE